MRQSLLPWVGLALLAAVLGARSSAAGALYTITDLGELTSPPNTQAATASVLPGPISEARALAGRDRIAGRSADPLHRMRAVTWTSLALPVALGPDTDAELAEAVGIDIAGNSVGFSSVEGGIDPFYWSSGGGFTNLGSLGGARGYAVDLNAAGVIVGHAMVDSALAADWYDRAFRSTAAGGLVDLGTLPGGTSSRAAAVNASGVIVGVSTDVSGRSRAVQWPSAGSAIDLGVGGILANSEARDINDAGGIVGVYDNADETTHAFYRDPGGTVHDLGVLPGGFSSRAEAINNDGWIVGMSDVDSSSAEAGVRHAVVWPGAGPVVDLNSAVSPPGWLLLEANDIDDNGNIVGVGINSEGRRHGYLLTTQTTPIALESLSGTRDGRFARVTWRIGESTNTPVQQVVVERAEAEAGPYMAVSPAMPATREATTFVDRTTSGDRTAWYRLRFEMADAAVGWSRTLGVAAIGTAIENALAVVAPFALDGVVLCYSLATNGPVTLDVVAIDGRRVRRLEQKVHTAGEFTRAWDRRDDAGHAVGRGVYFVTLRSASVFLAQKIVVVRR